MKNQALIDTKRRLEGRYTNAELKSKNIALRKLKLGQLTVKEFLEEFPGESIFDFKDLGRNCADLRRRINDR